MIHRYHFPTEIHFGPGARRELPKRIAELGFRKPLIVTDAGVARLPFFLELRALLPGAEAFSGVVGNPVLSQVEAGAEAYRKAGADSLVAVGGGAATDVAKAIAVAVSHPGKLFDYDVSRPGGKPVDRDVPPIAAVPTTAGTGSEIGRATVISEDDSHRKRILLSPKLLPKAVFADPELLLGLPPKITAATGMDAVTHLVEAYLSAGGVNPMCDGIALEGLKLAARGLKRSVENPRDLEARSDMLNAALMGAAAFQKGLGAVHSTAHALSTVLDLHHGLANGVMIPYVMEFNRAAVPGRMDDLARAVGAKDFVAWLRELRRDVGIPDKLAELGGKPEHLEPLTETAFADVCHSENPRPVTKDDFRGIFRSALS